MRIITGKFKGRKLFEVKSDSTRSTTDRAKEAMFSIIADNYNDLVVADFFSGSGSLNLEALSRGACHAYFFEKNHEALKVIRANIKALKLGEVTTIYEGDFRNNIARISQKVDILFLDPPYFQNLVSESLSLAKEYDIFNENAIIVCEVDRNEAINYHGYELLKEKCYGRVKLLFLRRKL